MKVIKCNIQLHAEGLRELQKGLIRQTETGCLVVPGFCEILDDLPDDEEILLAVDMPTAEWRGGRGGYTCSNCGTEAPNDGCYQARYCYECGRRMKRKGE